MINSCFIGAPIYYSNKIAENMYNLNVQSNRNPHNTFSRSRLTQEINPNISNKYLEPKSSELEYDIEFDLEINDFLNDFSTNSLNNLKGIFNIEENDDVNESNSLENDKIQDYNEFNLNDDDYESEESDIIEDVPQWFKNQVF